MSDFLKGAGGALGGLTGLLSGGALIDAAGGALGLPPLITQAAKTVVGAMTGNVLLAVDGAMGLAQELAHHPPATTEYTAPKSESRAAEGYARPESSEHGASPVPTRGSPEGGAVAGGSRLDSKMNDYFAALETLEQNFQALDAADGKLDGSLSRANLESLSHDTRVSPPLREAARFLLDNPGYFERLDAARLLPKGVLGAKGAANDDRFDLGGVRSELLHVKADFAQYGRPESTPAPSTPAPTGPARSSVKDIIHDPNMSLEEKLNTLLMGLTQKMDDEMLQAMDDLAAAQEKKSGLSNDKGNEKTLAQTQGDIDRISMRLQQLMEKRKTMFEMMSTLSMKFNEMAKTALSNMRGA